MVRARHHGVGSEDERRPRGADPADGDPRRAERLARPALRVTDGDARGRPRARAAHHGPPTAVFGGRLVLRRAARDRGGDRGLHAAVRRLAARDPPRARRRGRDADVAGEQPHRGWHRRGCAHRPRARRHSHPLPRRAERPLHRRRHVPRRLPARAPPGAEAEADRPRGRRWAARGPALRRAGFVHGRARPRDRGLRLLQLRAVRGVAGTCVSRLRQPEDRGAVLQRARCRGADRDDRSPSCSFPRPSRCGSPPRPFSA